MKELRILIFTALKDSSDYLSIVGGDVNDPRIYWQYTPQKDLITSSKLGYCVYYRSGTIDSGREIDIGGRADQIYVIEAYGKTTGLCEDIADVIVEIFKNAQFSTDTYSVLNSKANVVGSPIYQEGRGVFSISVNVRLTNVVIK